MATTSNKPVKKDNKKSFVSKHYPVLIILFIALVLGLSFGYQKYKDWENAQFLNGLATDFPLLISEIEQATGLELEQKTDCSVTTEKFTSGVKTCELSVAYLTDDINIQKAQEIVINSKKITSATMSENQRGYEIVYRNKNACTLSNGESIYLTCITAVREANVDLAKELFF